MPLHDPVQPAPTCAQAAVRCCKTAPVAESPSTAPLGGLTPQVVKSLAVRWEQASAWARALPALSSRQSGTAHWWPSRCPLSRTNAPWTTRGTCCSSRRRPIGTWTSTCRDAQARLQSLGPVVVELPAFAAQHPGLLHIQVRSEAGIVNILPMLVLRPCAVNPAFL